ncbi:MULTISPECIES: UDP-N-acetylmuramoyl-L-alanine--D-glutamate ligase [unclassified Treponema]|uniref:UDP-N-acetylmuramoyl-L-alanine--D-glutamate ligase n=1 Tax=unclassified Treponema TaxID=2638727 RepID=UPI0020A554B9|nr:MULTISPECIES: UDP-N-acetylmuramoyl-L-alanine--D-glutamate ligase [unclassified Treponema]UTC66655.1 UDP-N-acetylmuramoyl-L-alanine--D-glutamate ligase [Treponema sp. OMZ 789]UTC69387.1 UDP-N-acetylmuramoyl-L-alanine--D-glutamate ligase [Treponema sp. OMZ 790]UTC72102.1 UDP-N-acetylmuramoyl-L-alanine--D-glutamate ligase [Treponema sp. OMZ 791]
MQISLENIKNKKVTVMGLGLNGGGVAAARFFARYGAEVTVTDLKTSEELRPSIEKLSSFTNIRFVLGEHRIEDFKESDLVIKNPGVKLEGNVFLEAAKQVESDISVFLALSKAPVLAVTGSKGKSSTVSALYYGLKKLGYNAFLGGNITVSPLSFFEETSKDTPVVLELSSWQLADLKTKGLLKPKAAIITPIMPDHLNWYGTMEKYVADKKIIYENMDEADYLICNFDDGWGKIFAEETRANVFWYSEKNLPEECRGVFFNNRQEGVCNLNDEERLLLSKDAKVPGLKLKQNVLNAGLALLLYQKFHQAENLKEKKNKDQAEIIRKFMDEYSGIEHRLEFFYEKNGIKFYNDTAATIPEASAAAIEAFDKPPILICGGTNKNLNFIPLAEKAKLTKSIYLLAGTGTDLLIPLLKEKSVEYKGPFDGLDSLLLSLKENLEAGDIVILSPGAASFGMFKNEFDRGNKFKEKVKEIFC